MTSATQPITKVFCWAELLINDANLSKNFYQSLLGWQEHVNKMPQGGEYWLMRINNQDVVGMCNINAEMKEQGATASWNCYVAVEDADQMVSKAQQLGATVIMQPFDIMEMGRMAVLLDPTGVSFNLWQNKKSDCGERLATSVPGNVGWNELITANPERASEFYSKLFDWQIETETMENGISYTSFLLNKQPIAGMVDIDYRLKQGVGEDFKASWVPYFTVANLEQLLVKVKELKAQICYPPISITGVGKFTMLRDPTGVYFSVIEWEA